MFHSFKYYYEPKEVYCLFQIHLSNIPFIKKNDLINFFIKHVVIIYPKHYVFVA